MEPVGEVAGREVEVRVVLLASLPEQQWDDVRDQLARFVLAPEQVAFGGDPPGFIDLEREPERNVFVIHADDAVVGVGTLMTGPVDAELWPLQTHAIQLRGFVVDQRVQGRGIGTAASRQVIELARSIDPTAQHLTLTVNQRNPGARRTYEKVGFKVLPDHPYMGGRVGPQDIMYLDLT